MGKVSRVGVILALCVAMGVCNNIQPTPEIKTEAPPQKVSYTITHKDCPVYVLGELRSVKKHGERWLNDGSDCEICKCTDGQKRCYYHYCNAGLTEGYMTPPSVLGPGDKQAADQPPARAPLDDEDGNAEGEDEEEGSGARPWPDDYYKFIQQVLENHIDQVPSSSSGRRGKMDRENDKNPLDNETHDKISPSDLCGRPCKKNCPQGYKVDPVTGCRRCKCLNCPSMSLCTLKCPKGYALDQHSCKTCQCQEKAPKMAVITTSLGDDDFIVEEGYAVSGEAYVNENGEEQITYNQVGGRGSVYVTSKDEVYATAGNAGGSSDTVDPGCNNTRLGGCTDGHRIFTVGSWWERGPCISCTCKAPGNTECNVTQCAQLPCPSHQQIRIEEACCPLCEDSMKSPPITDRVHESRSTSRVPMDRMPPTRPHDLENDHFLQVPTEHDLSHRADDDVPRDDGSTTKSAVQATGADWSQVVVIVVPVLVIFILVASLIVHFWRRYHRDKYDINAYRPEETEKLRPVKTVDDHQPVRHV